MAQPDQHTETVPSLKAAAKLLTVSTRTLQNWRAQGCPGFDADGTVDVAAVREWAEKFRAERTGATYKDEKTLEEIRKLRLANDARERRLVERAWVAEQMIKVAGQFNQLRAKWESELPVKLAAAGEDIARNREVLRACFDEQFADLQSMAETFKDGETPEA